MDPNEQLTRRFSRAAAVHRRAMDAALSDFRITHVRYLVLAESERGRQADVAARLGLTRQAVHIAARALSGDGLIDSTRDGDGVPWMQPTVRGRLILKVCGEIVGRMEERISHELVQSESECLARVVPRYAATMERLIESGDHRIDWEM